MLNHLTKEKGEGRPGARLPAVASSMLQHQLLRGFDQEFAAAQGFLLFSLELLNEEKAKGRSGTFLRNCVSVESSSLHHLHVSC